MIYLISAACWFIVTIAFHIFFHKVRLIIGVSRLQIVFVFVFGFMGCIATNLWYLPQVILNISLSLTSVALYGGLTLAYASLTAAPIVGDVSPTTTLLVALFDKRRLTEQEILSLFSHEKVFAKRIQDLLDTKCIEKKKNMLMLTKRGRWLATVFTIYRKLLGLSEGG